MWNEAIFELEVIKTWLLIELAIWESEVYDEKHWNDHVTELFCS